MLLLIDNYDSFVYNLARYFERLGVIADVVRNDAIDVSGVRSKRPSAVVISPGPCTPREAGASLEIVQRLAGEVPILGVCLGHQVIAEAFGGRIVRAEVPVHGRASAVSHSGTGLFANLPSPLTVGRYHSLVVEPSSLPGELEATAWTNDGVLMAVAHQHWPVFGVQFHPESILTEGGHQLLANFLRLVEVSFDNQSVGLGASELREAKIAPPLPTGPVTF
jgi:anthranilate synthase/aminodeoxychorismate synthase-like glutamine amidotransferase